MKSFKTEDLKPAEIQNWLSHAIAPRPICFASTIDKLGNVNLSPFSYFNIFSVNPPICVFSPSRRVRDNTQKHTLQNIVEVPEVVINIVNYAMVQQTSLASTEYPKGTNEFKKAGFTELKSNLIKPPRVAEAPVQLECVVNDILPLGDKNGAGNLILAEVKLIHVQESVLNESGQIDQHKLDLVARLGGDWYARTTPESLFKIAKPLATLGVGVDALPEIIRNSKILTGNNLGQLGNVEHLPSAEAIENFKKQPQITSFLNAFSGDERTSKTHEKAKQLLDEGQVEEAWLWLVM